MVCLVAGLYATEVGGAPRVAPLCLDDVEITGHVLDGTATLVLRSTFSVAEAIGQSAYFFPLNADVAIYGLRVLISSGAFSRVVTGKVLKKVTARKSFSSAVEEGRPAALLESAEASEEVYKLALGALPADSSVVVEVSFAQKLRAEASSLGALRLVLPAALLHRYNPAASSVRLAGAVAEVAEVVASITGRGDAVCGPDHPSLRLQLSLAAATPVVVAESPSHGGYLRRSFGAAGDISGVEILVPKAQWLNPAAYADLSIVVDATPAPGTASAPGAFLWSELAVSSSRTPIAPFAAAVLEVKRAFADDVLERAAAVVAGVDCAALPASWRIAESDEEAAELAAADRTARLVPSIDPEAMALDEVDVVMPGTGVVPVRIAGISSPSDATLMAPPEFVFIIDCSGSMAGSRIQSARAALQLAIRSMPEGSRFQIIRFGSSVSPVFEEAPVVVASDANLSCATALLETLDADLGGTELDRPLRIALAPAPLAAALLRRALPRAPGDAASPTTAYDITPRALGHATRAVFLFTDGDVCNARDLIASASASTADSRTRIHCFGIGSNVSTELVQGLADATGGQCTMIADGEDFAPKVVNVMTATLREQVTVSVDWGLPAGSAALPSLASSTSIRPDDVARLYAAWLPDSPGSASSWTLAAAHVTLRRGDGLSVRIPVAAAEVAGMTAIPFYETTGRNVAVLAVKECLHALEAAEDRELTDLARCGVDVGAAELPVLPVTATIADVSTRFGVLARHTALFAEEELDLACEAGTTLDATGEPLKRVEKASVADILAQIRGTSAVRATSAGAESDDVDPAHEAVARAQREQKLMQGACDDSSVSYNCAMVFCVRAAAPVNVCTSLAASWGGTNGDQTSAAAWPSILRLVAAASAWRLPRMIKPSIFTRTSRLLLEDRRAATAPRAYLGTSAEDDDANLGKNASRKAESIGSSHALYAARSTISAECAIPRAACASETEAARSFSDRLSPPSPSDTPVFAETAATMTAKTITAFAGDSEKSEEGGEKAMPLALQLPAAIGAVAMPTARDAGVSLSARFNALVVLQFADGSFELNDALAVALGTTPLEGLMASLGTPAVAAAVAGLSVDVAARAWATALVVAALETSFASMRESWTLFSKRSSQWLRRAFGPAGTARITDLKIAGAATLLQGASATEGSESA